jgi:hypothetical protein
VKYFALPNLNWLDVTEVDPPSMPKMDEYPETKTEFREWCNSKSTKHCFYSAVEAIDPTHRVTVDNPAFKMHGLVVDYDAVAPQGSIDLIPENGAAGMLPRWVTRTYSNHRRVIWEFEKPILVDNEEITDRFMALLAKELKVKNILPNADQASFKRAQYFELGTDWQEIKGWNAIPASTLEYLFVKAATAKQLKHDGTIIPLEKVAEEVEARYPGRWPGEFVEGARGPLFWIEDGVDRVGCQVGEFGMLCYSERAGKSFLHWGEIFGPDFVRQYEAERIGSAAEGIWFDGQKYWRKNESDLWRARNKDDTIMWLKGQGISGSAMQKGMASDAEKVLLTAQDLREVKGAAPIVHDNREVVVINGERYLNISAIRIMQPADHGTPTDFPWLYEFFNKIWADPVETQRDHFLAWFQHFYTTALAGRPQQGQALIIAGPPSSGKTFLNHQILGRVMGGFSNATNYLMGSTSFNKQDSEVALWAIDDTRGASSWENKAAFSSAIKQHVANPQVRCEGKNQNAFTIPWRGRIVITCNQDEESLEITPQLNATIKDKLMLFYWSDWQAKFLPNAGSETAVAAELPYFLYWLINWKAPADVLNNNPRYHVNAYHHPKMLLHAHDASPSARLAELLDEWRKQFSNATSNSMADETGCCWMTATRLRKELSQDPSARDALKEFSRNRMAAALEALGEDYVCGSRTHASNKQYHIRIKPREEEIS